MDNKKFLGRLNQLIKEGDELIQEIPRVKFIDSSSSINIDQRIRFKTWRLSSLNLLRSKFGQSHIFYLNFKKAPMGNWQKIKDNKVIDNIEFCKEDVASFYSVLLYIKNEFELGFVEDAQHLYESNLFSNLLEQAFELLEKDYLFAAAIYSRLIIENFINDLCRVKDITLEEGKNYFADKITKLRQNEVFDLPTERMLQSIYDVGTYATHGKDEFQQYDKEKIKSNLEVIKQRILTIQ